MENSLPVISCKVGILVYGGATYRSLTDAFCSFSLSAKSARMATPRKGRSAGSAGEIV